MEGREGGGVALRGTRFATHRMLVVASMVPGVVGSGGSVVVDGFSVLLCAGEGGISVSLFVLSFFQFVFQFLFSYVLFSGAVSSFFQAPSSQFSFSPHI